MARWKKYNTIIGTGNSAEKKKLSKTEFSFDDYDSVLAGFKILKKLQVSFKIYYKKLKCLKNKQFGLL